MLLNMLKAKIHTVHVTEAELDYEGSIAIGRDLLKAAAIRPYEQVLVANFTNGNRWWTYAIPADPGVIGLNGGSARLGVVGDTLTILTFVQVDPEEDHCPRIVFVDKENRVSEVLTC